MTGHPEVVPDLHTTFEGRSIVQRTWWRGLRIADRRKTFTLRLLVQVSGFRLIKTYLTEQVSTDLSGL